MIPTLPPSVNSLYNVLFSMRRVELKPEVRLWKTQAKEYIPTLRVKESAHISFNAWFEGAWRHGNGKLKKRDVQNMTKCLIDCVAEKVGFDDSQVWAASSYKVEAEKEQVRVELIEFMAQVSR